MTSKEIEKREKENPSERLHDLIRNNLIPPVKDLLKKIEKTDDIKEAIKLSYKIHRTTIGIIHGLIKIQKGE